MLKSPPLALGIEEVKRLNMVDFLSRHYGLDFSKGGVLGHSSSSGQSQYCCLSPFKEERNPSFFVREVDNHWLFKDFCSGHGGSLIDFILLKEGFSQVSEALNHIGRLLDSSSSSSSSFPFPSPSPSPTARAVESSPVSPPCVREREREYDINVLYSKFRRNDMGKCRDYLFKRDISEEVIAALCSRGYLVHNMYKDISYCCFAVFDHRGQLCCLDNHQIGGDGKFVLGHKHPFSLDWAQLPFSKRVFVTESIIDYLSIKTLEGFNFRGVALLGNVLNFSSELFGSAREVVSALDGDSGGFRAFLDLEEKFSDRVIQVYDFGDSKDANEYLQLQLKKCKDKERQSGTGNGKRLSAGDKLSLYRDFQRSENKSEVASKWGINRSYMYDIVKECEELILSGFSNRRSGRKPSGQPETLDEACERLKKLEAENRRLDEERERYWVRNEFMKVRLKWAEREAEEFRGEVGEGEGEGEGKGKGEVESQFQPANSRNRKKHLKKKRRKKS